MTFLGGIPFMTDFINRRCMEICIIGFAFYMYSCLLSIVYRYLQTTGKHRFLTFMETKKSILFHIIVVLSICSFIIIPIQDCWMSSDELKDLYKIHFPEIYEKIANKNVLGVKVRISLISRKDKLFF